MVKINQLEVENLKRIKAVTVTPAETGLTTIPEQKPEPEGLTVWQMVGAFLAMGVTALVAIGMALVL